MVRLVRLGLRNHERSFPFDAFCFSNSYFFTEPNLSGSPFFKTKLRSARTSEQGKKHRANILSINWSSSGVFSKCFQHAELVESVHNHTPLRCWSQQGSPNCSVFFVEPALGKLNHYKSGCQGAVAEQCHTFTRSLVTDYSMEQFEREARARAAQLLL